MLAIQGSRVATESGNRYEVPVFLKNLFVATVSAMSQDRRGKTEPMILS